MKLKNVQIVDYGLGNLFSIKNACLKVGLIPEISSEPEDLNRADIVILPGVGAFGDAMTSLKSMNLVEPIREVAAAGKPLIGICLGMQLLMSESSEFGIHKGLDIITGTTSKLIPDNKDGVTHLKIPHIGWNRILKTHHSYKETQESSLWEQTPMANLEEGEYMYFVHSYYVSPTDTSIVISNTTYGDNVFCSSFKKDNIFAVQFHPERSGPAGLQIYSQLDKIID